MLSDEAFRKSLKQIEDFPGRSRSGFENYWVSHIHKLGYDRRQSRKSWFDIAKSTFTVMNLLWLVLRSWEIYKALYARLKVLQSTCRCGSLIEDFAALLSVDDEGDNLRHDLWLGGMAFASAMLSFLTWRPS